MSIINRLLDILERHTKFIVGIFAALGVLAPIVMTLVMISLIFYGPAYEDLDSCWFTDVSVPPGLLETVGNRPDLQRDWDALQGHALGNQLAGVPDTTLGIDSHQELEVWSIIIRDSGGNCIDK